MWVWHNSFCVGFGTFPLFFLIGSFLVRDAGRQGRGGGEQAQDEKMSSKTISAWGSV